MDVEMEKQLRLDKYLADMGVGTRTEVKQLIKKGLVIVNQTVIKRPETKVTQTDEVIVQGTKISYVPYQYFMLHKPAGVVSATQDRIHKTVMDCMEHSIGMKRDDYFPVGRLDIDTEGLLLITNDGELAHNLLSPRKHVQKTYYATIDGVVTEKEILQFAQGLDLQEFIAKPAKLVVLSSTDTTSEVEVTIYEGKFHQVKRMFEAVGMKVRYLKRLSMGSLVLDKTLAVGAVRQLTEEEIELLKKDHDNVK